MVLIRVHRIAIPSHILEIISTHSASTFTRRYYNVSSRPSFSEVNPSSPSGVLSKLSGLIHTDQALKPTDAEAEAHNRRLSLLRSALATRDLAKVQQAYDAMVNHHSEAAIMGRDWEEISRILDARYSTSSSPDNTIAESAEMALRAAARGHTAGFKACLLLYLKIGDPRGALSLHNRYHYFIQSKIVEESKRGTIARSAEASGDIPGQGPGVSDASNLVLIAITAHAMEDRFDDALDYILTTPMNIRLPARKVQNFCRIYLPSDSILSKKLQRWTEELVYLRLVSKEASLNKYISDLGDDKHVSPLEKLYAFIVSHLSNVNGRLIMDSTSSLEDCEQTTSRRSVILMPRNSWTSFLEAFFKCYRLDLVEAVWNDAMKFGLTPNHRMWSSLIDGYGHQRNCEMAKSIWNRMLAAGVKPDEACYGAMIAAYFSDFRPDEGYALFQQFRQGRMGTIAGRESLSSPQVLRLFNIALHGLCTNAKDNLAHSILSEMVEQGPKPDIVSYNTFLRHYERIGDMKGLAGILRNLRPAGVQPDVHSFTTVLSALYKAGNPDAHAKTLEIMKAMDVQPNVATYSAIIHFLARQGGEENLRKAGELLEQMENEPDKDSRPNEVTYTGLIAGVHRDTSLSGQNVKIYTKELLSRMRKQGMQPNRTTYNILIKACLDNPQPVGLETALQYYHQMKKRGPKLMHETWYVILAGLLRRRDLSVAQEIMTDMYHSGHEPNSALSTLISRLHREIALDSTRVT